jgi:hypothetical protein
MKFTFHLLTVNKNNMLSYLLDVVRSFKLSVCASLESDLSSIFRLFTSCLKHCGMEYSTVGLTGSGDR